MVIRKATNFETQKIISHSLEVLKESAMGHVTPNQNKAHQMVAPFLTNGGYYLIYNEKNVIKGWIGVGKNVNYHTDEVVGFIPELYCFPEFRGQGIAKKLCEEALRKLKEEGYQNVQLNVFAGNHVKDLYKRLGFREVSALMEINLKNHT